MSEGRQTSFSLSALDIELLDAVEKALAARIPTAIVLPVPGAPLPLTLGVEAVLAAIRNRGRMDARVGVASPRLSERQIYDQLAFQGQRLADRLPRVRISGDGRAAIVGSPASDMGGRLYLTSNAQHLAGLAATLETLIVDEDSVDAALLKQFLTLRPQAPVLYTTANPADPLLDTVRAACGVVWGYDARSMLALAELTRMQGRNISARRGAALVMPADQLASIGASRVFVHVPVGTQSGLDQALTQLWRATAALSHTYQSAVAVGDRNAIHAMRWAWGAYNALAALPVTPERYDRQVAGNPYSVSLKSSPSIARQFAVNAVGQGRTAWAQVADSLAHAVEATRQQPRTEQILLWLEAIPADNERRAVVTRNHAAAAALRAVLRESTRTRLGWDARVDVMPLGQLARVGWTTRYAELCLPGTVPRSQSWLLAAPSAVTLTILAVGPQEGWRVARAVTSARGAALEVRRETVQVSARRLQIDVAVPLDVEDPVGSVTVVGSTPLPPFTADGSALDDLAWDPFATDVLAILADEVGVGNAAKLAPATTGKEALAEAIAIYVDEARTGERAALLLRPNELVHRRQGTTVQRVAAKALEAGDNVVLVDRGARRDLFDEVAERLAERPGYVPLVALIDLWHERAAAAAECGMTYGEILARMDGTAITSPGTIGTWIRGSVDGPLDGDDVARFAQAVNDETLASIAAQVAPALSTMHRVRRRLGYWLAKKVDAAPAGGGDTIVDAELGMHVADLLESVSDHTVIDVDLRPGYVAPVSALGIILPARLTEDLHKLAHG